MSISAKIITDSIYNGHRLTTMELRYPRFIHAEFMTHRVFSRNASSSRAIPVRKLINSILVDMAEPVEWGANQAGMQARTQLTGWRRVATRLLWRTAGYLAVGIAHLMATLGAHKQIVNRIIEPWSHITVVCTATEWDNFYKLRLHPDADPTMRELANRMNIAHLQSTPRDLKMGEWHLPYIREPYHLPNAALVQSSVARCARVSFLNHDGSRPSYTKDIELFQRLAGSVPQHLSPTEHQATPSGDDEFHANFRGWVQYRKNVEHV